MIMPHTRRLHDDCSKGDNNIIFSISRRNRIFDYSSLGNKNLTSGKTRNLRRDNTQLWLYRCGILLAIKVSDIPAGKCLNTILQL